MRSLRAREFLAIGVAVIAAVAVTAVVAALLVRRSVKHEALKALARQTELIATQERATTAPSQKLTSLGDFFKTQQERLAIISLAYCAGTGGSSGTGDQIVPRAVVDEADRSPSTRQRQGRK